LLLAVGFLTWRVVGERSQHCYWAVTVGTNEMGSDEVPYDSSSVRTVLDPPSTTSGR
jgi:hypothetical protein